MKTLKEICLIIFIVLGFAIITYGLWKTERWINWNFSYGQKSNSQFQELNKRVNNLNIRVKELEK